MQKIALILFIVIFFTGCKKDDVVRDRDKFIGKWSGLLSKSIKMNDNTIQEETIEIMETIVAGSEDNQVIFSKGLTNEMIATVSDSTITIPEQTHYDVLNDRVYESSIVGTGVLSKNGVLTISSKQVAIQSDYTIEWTFTESLKLN